MFFRSHATQPLPHGRGHLRGRGGDPPRRGGEGPAAEGVEGGLGEHRAVLGQGAPQLPPLGWGRREGRERWMDLREAERGREGEGEGE